MRKITAFNFLTLNGFYKGEKEDINWHHHGGEEADFAGDAADPERPNDLMFGRITYEMMAGFWTTEAGRMANPRVAEGMNRSGKYVFSRTLKSASWKGTKILHGDIVTETIRLKESSGADITILGSGQIITQLAAHGLIDSFTVMIDPVVLGKGTSIFGGLPGKLDLALKTSRIFTSGVVLLTYEVKK